MRDWNLEVITVGPLQMNAVLLTSGEEAILVDPGAEAPRLLERIVAGGHTLTALLATHGHFDHVADAAAVQEHQDLPLRCHPDALALIEHLPEIQAAYGSPPSPVPRCQADLTDGAAIPFAAGEIAVSHVPGHEPGHVMFLLPGHALVGDCVFHGSVGRTDLPGGDFDILAKSIRERIYTLPDETIIVPGHGPDTTVGREKAGNPFVRP